MAAARRRSTRKNAQSTESNRAQSEASTSTAVPGQTEDSESSPNATHPAAAHSDEERCPACKDGTVKEEIAGKESWVRCDACKKWFHWRCAGEGDELETVDKWFCRPCREVNPARVITRRPPARKSTRTRAPRDYASLHNGVRTSPGADGNKWLKMLEGKAITKDSYPRMLGTELNLDWLNSHETAMTEPIVIEKPDGLGMKMPPDSMTVSDVATIVGPDTPVEVMDVATQSNTPGYNLAKWTVYYNTTPDQRDKIRNVISLEISDTELARMIVPPRLVTDIDWVDNFWPSNKKGKGHSYPKVQLYCLMSVAEAWTDWHIDFAGSSVYYHIFHGSKVFYFIRPTAANLAAYERWSGTEIQTHTWLGDMVDEVFEVHLSEGNTMIIPTGWIHAVYTPMDSLVFGGNFLHSYNVATQLRVREIEIATHVPKKFRFPHFARLCWYVAEKFLRDLKAKEEFPPRVLESMEVLVNFLMSEVRVLERGSESGKKEVKEQMPSDKVKDGPALARELRWRLCLIIHGTSDDEGELKKKTKAIPSSGAAKLKRKRSDETVSVEPGALKPDFRHFIPKAWQGCQKQTGEDEQLIIKAVAPHETDSQWAERWMDWVHRGDEDGGEEAHVGKKSEVVVKVRRTSNGIERQRVERLIEIWDWSIRGQDQDTDLDHIGRIKPACLPTEGVDGVAKGNDEAVDDGRNKDAPVSSVPAAVPIA